MDQLTNYESTYQPQVIEYISSEEEYLGGGSRRKSEDEARPKRPTAEESQTVEECPTNKVFTEKYNNNEDRATLLLGKYIKSLMTIPIGQNLQDRLTEMK